MKKLKEYILIIFSIIFEKEGEKYSTVVHEVVGIIGNKCWGYRQYPNVEGSTYPSICEGNLRIGV